MALGGAHRSENRWMFGPKVQKWRPAPVNAALVNPNEVDRRAIHWEPLETRGRVPLILEFRFKDKRAGQSVEMMMMIDKDFYYRTDGP
ncbi:jg974 [Pararge aegeria aegeria]|uniref:Jg974 protein n=1 Tax=Pararge aegeria aegeria TaxID=348720 RepID=A0A8S4S9W8_9NEOP|nr:jg974 [Pararge aegeria aegeria]